MSIHWKRLALVLGIAAVLVGTGAGVYTFAFRGSNESAALTASAEKLIEAGDFDAASVVIEKLVIVQPHAGYPLYLKALTQLKGKKPTDFGPTDSTGVAAVRSLMQATMLEAKEARDPKTSNLLSARKMLVSYFLNGGDVSSAAEQAKLILEQQPNDLESQYAIAASLIPNKSSEAIPYVDQILSQEKPLRPRSVWLAAEVGDVVRNRADLTTQATEWMKANETHKFEEISDLLAIVELRLWRAWRSNEGAVAEKEVRAAINELRVMCSKLTTSHLSPRLILRSAARLLPSAAQRNEKLSKTYAVLEPEVDAFIDEVFKIASDAKVLDPALYVGQARRLRSQNRTDEAVKLLHDAIATAAKEGPETRQLFVDCDLWLAEYYLDEGKGELAEPHIQVCLEHPVIKPAGQMLKGYRLMQKGDFTKAADELNSALAKLNDHGAAHALYGLCQLRRGMISEGRQHLEQGVRLGARSPRYKAWLALALAEGGYHDQAMIVARELLESGEYAVIGRALVGQLRLQAGDFEKAADDLQAAYSAADNDFRPAIQLAQAELALANAKEEQALGLINELKKTSLADQAFAIHYRFLRRNEKMQEADAELAEGRKTYPDSMLLLAIDVQRLIEHERFDEAEKMLTEVRAAKPKEIGPVLLLAEVYDHVDKGEKTVEFLKATLKEMPGEASLKIRLVEKLLSMREFADVDAMLQEMRKDNNINPTTVDYLLARSAAMRGDMKSAQEFVERAASKDPDNPTLKFLRGQLAAQKGDYSTATEMFEQSLSGGNYRQQAVQALFESLLRVGDTTRAVEVLGQAEKRGQHVRSLRMQLLNLLARQENWDVMDREISQILSKNPSEEDYLLVISSFRYVRQPMMASRYLQRALREFPESPSLQEQEASLLVETGDYENAEKKLTELVAKHPENAMLHVLRIFMLEQTNRQNAIRASIEDAWQKCPGHPAIAALRVQAMLKEGQGEEALRFAEKAKKEYPDLPEARYLVARMYESIGMNDKALALLSVLATEDPKNSRVAENYFRILVQTGLPREVQPAIEKLIAAQPDNKMIIGALAEYRALLGDLKGAESTIQKLDQIKSAGSLSDYTKAVLAFAKRDFKEADRLAKIVLADSKGHVPATFLLARLRAAEGKYGEAIELVSRVCRQQPRNPTANLFLARLLGETGEWPKAEQVCREYLKIQKSDRAMRLMLARALLARGGDARAKEAGTIAWAVFQEGIRGGEELEAVMNILFAAGQSDKCRQIISEFESRGSSPDNLLAAGRASFIAGDFPTAARLADQVLVARSDDVEALMLAADTETRVGLASEDATHFEKAVTLYERLLEKDKTSTAAANNLAWTQGVLLGKESKALEGLLRRVPAATSPSPMVSTDILDTIGTLYMRMNRLDQAREYFEAIIHRDQSNAVANFRIGQILDRQGRRDRAEQSFARAKQLAPTENWDARKVEAGLAN